MFFLYNFGIKIYYFFIYIFHFFNQKANLWIKGREKLLERIEKEVDSTSQSVWFHFASLGEFEQGRPVLEKLKIVYPQLKIIITFFSPSGYELRKNYAGADHVFYLPLDTKSNAERLVKLFNPKLVVFTKYEFWYHYFNQLHKEQIPLYIISGIFRNSQPFFKWYGALNRKILSFVTHFFVQDEGSKNLLSSINLHNVTVSGDTRFDRVAENAANPKSFELVKVFCGEARVFVAGSTWPEDESLIAELVKTYSSWKFVIAPHEIKEEKIKTLINLLPQGSSLRYSELIKTESNEKVQQSYFNAVRVLIIDNIGMLSSLYQYGQIAYIGGGFGVGIHNTLEAAAFGVPVIFGPNYHKFLEAKALIRNGGGFSIKDLNQLKSVMRKLENDEFRKASGKLASAFVQTQKGATGIIVNFITNQNLITT